MFDRTISKSLQSAKPFKHQPKKLVQQTQTIRWLWAYRLKLVSSIFQVLGKILTNEEDSKYLSVETY